MARAVRKRNGEPPDLSVATYRQGCSADIVSIKRVYFSPVTGDLCPELGVMASLQGGTGLSQKPLQA